MKPKMKKSLSQKISAAEQKEFASLKIELLFQDQSDGLTKIHECINFPDFIKRFGLFYIDKTLWIKQLFSVTKENERIVNVSRPQKMGKSLNMSMLKTFLDVSLDSQDIFKKFLINDDPDFVIQNLNKHPVISIKMPKSLLRINCLLCC